MLIATADEITGDADIQRAIAAVRHYINKAAFHRSHREDVDARHKAGHDGGEARRNISSIMARHEAGRYGANFHANAARTVWPVSERR